MTAFGEFASSGLDVSAESTRGATRRRRTARAFGLFGCVGVLVGCGATTDGSQMTSSAVTTASTTAATPSGVPQVTPPVTTTTPPGVVTPQPGVPTVVEPVPVPSTPGTGETSTTTTTAPTPATTEPVTEADLALIDDLEDGNAVIAEFEERQGQWSAYNDATSGATQTPAAGKAVTPEAGGANGSQFALHTSGSGFSEWGAGIQLDFKNSGSGASSREPFDASHYAGISFYAKGSGSPRVELATPATTDSAGGGSCTESCFDTHGKSITLGADWALFTIPFDDLVQEGWGAEAAFSPAELLGLAFKVSGSADAPADFDFWIDDVRFVDEAGNPGGTPGGSTPTPPATPEPEPEPVSMDPTSEPGQCSDMGGYNGNGSVTYYYFDQGSSEVNCSYAIVGRNPDKVAHIATGDGGYFGAMNTADYNNAAMCGACVEVTRDGNRKAVVTIVDQCPVDTNPKCQKGHIDLSVAAFDQLGNRGNEGYLGTGNGGQAGSISWKYVECPTSENISFKLKEPDNANWNQLLVQGHKYPIKSVQIGGQEATRQSYNYWEPPNGKMGKAPYEVKVTDINGGVVTAFVPQTAGDVDSGVQLSCQ